MTTGWTQEWPYHVFTDPAFVLSLLLDPDEPLDQVCNCDAFLDIPGEGRWTATIFSVDEVRRLLDRWRITGESSYFTGVDNVIVREPGIDSIATAVRELVEDGSYDLVLVKCDDDDSPDPLETLAEFAEMPGAEITDEHVRWAIYQHAIQNPEVHRELRIAVTKEPVHSLAAAVVTALFDHVPPSDRPSWIRALPRRMRGFPTRRAEEMAVVEAHISGPPPIDISTWSDWLLRRVAESTATEATLTKLTTEARTKRSRNLATQRLTTLRQPPS
ncbi:hypothetical protein OG474_08210 [Kribbella sp. NBC_01505]|uniref:hypothetical protein n=1 Tax=Kribbella sp. NBC_01505 TaxID=2903580 RepID=UPI00386CB6F7